MMEDVNTDSLVLQQVYNKQKYSKIIIKLWREFKCHQI
jgi:hypothetical protein